MRIKRFFAAALAATAIVSFVSCDTDLSSTKEESRTVMTVDGYEVPYEMYRYAAMMHLRDKATAILSASDDAAAKEIVSSKDSEKIIKAAVEKLNDEEKKTIKKEVEAASLETVVNTYSIFKAAKAEGIDPFGEMINELCDMEMEKIRATYKDDEEYLDTIKLFYMNHSVYSMLTRYEIVFNELYEAYVKKGLIATSDEAVIEHMTGKDAARAKQILISFEKHSEDEAYSIAAEVKAEVDAVISEDGVADEAKFDAITDKHGEDLYTFKNRDGYYICRGYSDKDFENAVFALEVGHVSDIVRTSAGYSIILRAEIEKDYIEKNLNAMREVCVGGIYRTMLDEISANAEAKTNDEFEKIDLFSIK